MKKVFKVFGITIMMLIAIGIIGFITLKNHPRYVAILIFGDGLNKYESYKVPEQEVRKDGVLYVNDIKYGEQYPNSYLDIYYPTEDITVDRPTIFYIHGGGFFMGSKVSGDPLAEGDGGDAYFNRLIKEGYNLVKIDYALTPKYYQPVQLKQVDQALKYLTDHSEELGLNMDNVVIMGGSGGAVFTTQYGAILTNPEYARRIGVNPSIQKEQIKALVIDDDPIDLDRSSYFLNVMAFAQIGTDDRNSEAFKLYQAGDFVNENYIPSFLVSANGDEFVDDVDELYENLKKANVDVLYYTKTEEEAGKLGHCFMEVNYADNKYAKEVTEQMLDFIAKYTGIEKGADN